MTDAEFIDALAMLHESDIWVVRWMNWRPGQVAVLDREYMLRKITLSPFERARLMKREDNPPGGLLR